MFVQQKKKMLNVLTELQEFASSLWALQRDEHRLLCTKKSVSHFLMFSFTTVHVWKRGI